MHYFTLRANSVDEAVQQATEMLRQSNATEVETTVALANLKAHLQAFGALSAEERFDVHMNGSAVDEAAVLLSCGSGCSVTRVRTPVDQQTIAAGDVGTLPL